MADLLTVAQVQAAIETDLSPATLQIFLDDADAEIIARLGLLASQTEVLSGGRGRTLQLARRATAIVSASEEYYRVTYAIDSTDYSLWADGRTVERLITGDNPFRYWRGTVTIVYTPIDETARRTKLELDLVRLAIKYSGLASETIGDHKTQGLADYSLEREKLFRALSTSNRRLIS